MRDQRGFSLLELLMVVGIIAVIAAIAIPTLQAALLRAHVASVTTDAKALHTAFKQHYIDQSEYPFQTGSDAFDLATFEPLRSQGYYTGSVWTRLAGRSADGFDSPDDGGMNQEFWLEMTLAYDQSVRFLVADSDDAPLGGGDWYDGVFLYRDGQLKALHEVTRQ